MRTLELATNCADDSGRIARLGELLPDVLARYGVAPPSPESTASEHRATVTMPRDAGRRRLDAPPHAGLLRRPA